DLADETDVFMEFGHLSNETRKKIEEFRRRRKQAEEYNENSPVKPPKTARKDGEQVAEMKSEDKSLRGIKDPAKEKDSDDPLERLRQIENRLGQQRKKNTLSNVPQTSILPEKVNIHKREAVRAVNITSSCSRFRTCWNHGIDGCI
ncbi:hypothetical protein TELCIR_25469, partial [Teladorsagia circumcincta]